MAAGLVEPSEAVLSKTSLHVHTRVLLVTDRPLPLDAPLNCVREGGKAIYLSLSPLKATFI